MFNSPKYTKNVTKFLSYLNSSLSKSSIFKIYDVNVNITLIVRNILIQFDIACLLVQTIKKKVEKGLK